MGVKHHGLAVGIALNAAVHERGGDIGFRPRGDLRIVAEAGREYAVEQRLAGQFHAQCEKLAARDRAVGVKQIRRTDLLPGADALLGQQNGGIFLGAPGHVTVRDGGFLLFDADDDGSLLRFVSVAVHRLVAEVVATALAFIRGVDKFAVFLQFHNTLDRLGRQSEGDRIAVRIHGGELAANGDVAVGRQLKVLGERSGVVAGLGVFGVGGRQRQAQRQHTHGCKQFLFHKKTSMQSKGYQ